MKAVGIKALKDNLSKYLRMVRAGEIVWVTDRDEIIAEIHQPTVPIPGNVSVWDAFMNLETRKGSIKRGSSGVVPSLSHLVEESKEVVIDLDALLDNLRGDRDLLL